MSQSFRLATWNVNSLRMRLDQLGRWFELRNFPEIVCLQETKVEDNKFPLEVLQKIGYEAVFHGQKSYNGVAILSRLPISDVRFGTGNKEVDKEARVISATIGGIRVVNAYVPNGQAPQSEKYIWKFEFYRELKNFLKKALLENSKVAVCGDFNIAPGDLDVWNPNIFKGAIMFTDQERKIFKDVLDLGFVDLYRTFNPEGREYSWFDYVSFGWQRMRGWRIDFILSSPELAKHAVGCKIDCEPRGWEKPSDHCPVVAKFEV